MTEEYDANRRDFLTGKAIVKKVRQVGDQVADLVDEIADAFLARDTVRLSTRAMGCEWCVIMNPGPPRQVMCASDALDVVHRCEDQLTVYRNDSDIAKINSFAAETPQALDEDLLAFLEHCQQLWQETDHAFDPASGALIQTWKRARQDGRVPSEDEIADALSKAGWQHITLDSSASKISFDQSGLSLDFGAIGKGYGIDKAAEHLDTELVENFLIHGGRSSLFARGNHADIEGWPIGIKNPLFTDKSYGTLILKDQGMSTSGSNIQYFRHQGKRYGHILDPRTGWPADKLLSVTVIADTATDADAISTAFYAMGLDNALTYCENHQNVGAILVPPPTQGRNLEPIVINIPDERLRFSD